MEAFLQFLRQHYNNAYQGIPQIITHENVNTKLTFRWANTPGASLLSIATSDYNEGNVVAPLLLALGARIEIRDIFWCKSYILPCLLDAGADPNTPNHSEFMFPDSCRRFDEFVVMADYGTKPRPDFKWKMTGRHVRQREYLQQLDRRVASCRAALLALGAYCRRSPYTALRAVYKELAKEMWRMRGGGERCGPRGEGWKGTK